MSKDLVGIFFVFLFLFSGQSVLVAGDPSANFVNIKKHLQKASVRITDINKLLVKSCSALLEEDGEIFSLILQKVNNAAFEHVLLISCPKNIEIYKMAVKVASREKNSDALGILYTDALYINSQDSPNYFKFLFKTCVEAKNYDCIRLFDERLCRMVDEEGRNVLHLAAIHQDAALFDQVNHCKLLINSKDHEGKYPMEYIKDNNKDLAVKFNTKWLEVAKERFLKVETVIHRHNICTEYKLNCGGNYFIEHEGGTPSRGVIFKEAFEAGIEDADDFYCPYLGMKLDLVTGKGHDETGVILEWLSYLLNDIFGAATSSSESPETFKAAMFIKWPDNTGVWVPTGDYSLGVYEFAGKVVALAKYYNLGLSYDVGIGENVENSNPVVAFMKGDASMKFLRLESHQVGEAIEFILKGRDDSRLAVRYSDRSLFEAQSNREFFKNFKSFREMSDKDKLRQFL